MLRQAFSYLSAKLRHWDSALGPKMTSAFCRRIHGNQSKDHQSRAYVHARQMTSTRMGPGATARGDVPASPLRSYQRVRNYQSRADESGDNYFVSFSQPRPRGDHWTFHACCVLVLGGIGWQARRLRRDFVAHSANTIFDGFLLAVLCTVLGAMLLPRERDPNERLEVSVLPFEATKYT